MAIKIRQRILSVHSISRAVLVKHRQIKQPTTMDLEMHLEDNLANKRHLGAQISSVNCHSRNQLNKIISKTLIFSEIY